MSSDLGVSWTQIGSNVPSGRYYWRRLDTEIEGDLTTVYFEQRLTKESTCVILIFLHTIGSNFLLCVFLTTKCLCTYLNE